MTTIAALHIPGYGTVVGADSQYTLASRKSYLPNGASKFSRHKDWVIASAGSLKIINIVQMHCADLFDDLDDVRKLPFRLTELLKAAEQHPEPDNESGVPVFNADFLVANSNAVWMIDCSMALLETPPGVLAAGGSGSDYALAADHLHLYVDGVSPEERVNRAIMTAACFDIYTGGRIDITHIKEVDHSYDLLKTMPFITTQNRTARNRKRARE